MPIKNRNNPIKFMDLPRLIYGLIKDFYLCNPLALERAVYNDKILPFSSTLGWHNLKLKLRARFKRGKAYGM